jgi:beta-mannosidase
VDFYLRPKAAYYTVKRALAPILLGLVSEAGSVVCWCACALQGKFTGSLEIAIWNLEGNQVSKHTFEMEINPNNITDLASLSVSQGELVYSARLLVNDAVVVRASLWPEPFKYQTFANPGVEVLTLDSDNIRLRVRRPVKGLWLDDGERRTWSDNFLDVFPDDPQTIYAPGVEVENIKLRWLE